MAEDQTMSPPNSPPMTFHPHLPLSFKTERRSCGRNRYTPEAIAVMRAHRRACAWFVAAMVLLPVAMAGLFLILKHYKMIR